MSELIKTEYDKYIVIKMADIKKYTKPCNLSMLNEVLFEIEIGRMNDGNDGVNLYWICNQDEPYSEDVINIILKGECDKLKNITNK